VFTSQQNKDCGQLNIKNAINLADSNKSVPPHGKSKFETNSQGRKSNDDRKTVPNS
jgi:hypothetical protein